MVTSIAYTLPAQVDITGFTVCENVAAVGFSLQRPLFIAC